MVNRNGDAGDRGLVLAARATSLLVLVVFAVSFASAGGMLQGLGSLDVHGAAAIALHIVTGVLAILLALVALRRKRGFVLAAVATAVFALTFVQALVGDYASAVAHLIGALVLAGASVWVSAVLFQPRLRSANG